MPHIPQENSEFSPAAGSGGPTRLARIRTGRICPSALRYSTLLALFALAGGSAIHLAPVSAQVPPVTVTLELLAAGFSPDRRIRIQAMGPSDVLQTRIVLQPDGDTGWHTHPGPVIVVVRSGTLTEYHDNGCVSVYQAGSVFFESAGKVHRVINEGAVESESYATFLIPHGSEPLEEAADPGDRVCRPHGDRDHHGEGGE